MQVLITRKAEKELDKLPDSIAWKIIEHLRKLGKEPFPANYKKLAGVENYRIRVGSYRAIYTVDKQKKIVTILRVADRKMVYR